MRPPASVFQVKRCEWDLMGRTFYGRGDARKTMNVCMASHGELNECSYTRAGAMGTGWVFSANKTERGVSHTHTHTHTVVARSKTWVCGRSLAGIAGSNTAGTTDVCIL
jgi:hypothetical protein